MQPSEPPDLQTTHRARPSPSRPLRVLWIGLGGTCLAVGAVGVVVPGLPTTPFLILAAACFIRSSQRLYDRLLSTRVFGPAIRDFREGRGVPRRVKWLALATMGVFVGFAVTLGIPPGQIALRIVVLGAALVGAIYVLRLPTRS